MRVVVDLRSVNPGMTGIGRYAQNLALSLSGQPEIELVGLTSPAARNSLDPFKGRLVQVKRPGPDWEELGLPDLLSSLDPDIYHSPLFALPSVRACAYVCTLHDVVPLARPDLCPDSFQEFFHRQIERSIRSADHIVTVSNFSRRDIQKHLGAPDDRISVVHEPVSPRFRPLPQEQLAQGMRKLGLQPGFILYVGALDRRKNLLGLLDACRMLTASAPPLVIVGGSSGDSLDLDSEVRARGLERRVHCLGRVADGTLGHLYCAADLFVFPSLYEGFGLPVLEAMACGTPVLTSNTTSLPEVVGDAAVLVDPQDPESIRDGISRVLSDRQLQLDLSKRGRTRAALFSLEQQGSAIVKLYEQLSARVA